MNGEPPLYNETEARSSVKLTRNAKGFTQAEVKVYAATDDPIDIKAATELAQEIYDGICQKYPEVS